MRRVSLPFAIRPAALGLIALAGALATLGGPRSAYGQVPEPRVPDIQERSGLLQRYKPYPTKLPKDPYIDNFYGNRYGDHLKILDINKWHDGGLYGVRLPARDTASVYPFFYGAPGKSTITAQSRSWRPSFLRGPQQLLHQRKPVGMYYDRGSYVPIYDLDPLAPGPGPDYWPWFWQGSPGG